MVSKCHSPQYNRCVLSNQQNSKRVGSESWRSKVFHRHGPTKVNDRLTRLVQFIEILHIETFVDQSYRHCSYSTSDMYAILIHKDPDVYIFMVELTVIDVVHCIVLCRVPSNKSEHASPSPVFLCTRNEEEPLSLAGQKESDEPRPMLIDFMTKHAQKASLFTALSLLFVCYQIILLGEQLA